MISPLFVTRVVYILSCCLFSALISAKPQPVIFDTDIGSDIDDMFALSLILKSPELDLKLITTVSGDTRYRMKVAAKFLEVAGRTDIPVASGPTAEASAEFLRPWISDFDIRDYPGPVNNDAVDSIVTLLESSDQPVTIIVAGPMTNIAAVLNKSPGLAEKMHIIGMQGSIYKGYRGGEPVAEYNVASDAAAFTTVLHADLAAFAITPLDTCGDMVIDGKAYQQLKTSDDPQLQTLFHIYPIWADLVTWDTPDYLDAHSSVLYDTVAVYLAMPGHDWLPVEPINLVVTDDGFTRPVEHGAAVVAALRWENLPAFKAWFTQRMLNN